MPSELDNVALTEGKLLEMPAGNLRFGTNHPFNENADRHDETKLSHADAHLPVANFIGWRFVDKRRQAVTHLSDSPISITSERFGNAPQKLNGGKRIKWVNVPFLPTALFARRMAVAG